MPDTGAYQNPRICSDCISSLTPRRAYAAAAAQAAAPAETATPPPSSDAATAVVPYKIQSGILLSRPPIITRELSSFEKAFYFYQRRLNERLAMPFTRYFYFKKDTPADNAWKAKAKLRNGAPARDLGGYNPYGELGWNDELLVGDQTSEPEVMRQRLIEDAVNKTEEEKDAGQEETEEAVKPLPRRTEADIKKDTKRLDRKLERTLYLVVKNKDGKWVLPAGEVIGRENLHQVGSESSTHQTLWAECANISCRRRSASSSNPQDPT
jgi:large subunit ribosomal protein L46